MQAVGVIMAKIAKIANHDGIGVRFGSQGCLWFDQFNFQIFLLKLLSAHIP